MSYNNVDAFAVNRAHGYLMNQLFPLWQHCLQLASLDYVPYGGTFNFEGVYSKNNDPDDVRQTALDLYKVLAPLVIEIALTDRYNFKTSKSKKKEVDTSEAIADIQEDSDASEST